MSCWHFHFLPGNVIIADNWLIIHNFNRLTNQRAGKVLRHQKVLRHRVAFLKVLNWSDFLILPLPDFAKGCRLFNSLWGFESHCVTWTVMRTWQIKILCTTCAGVRFPFLDFYFPWCPACLIRAKRPFNSASRARYAQTRHHRADHLRAWKDYLRIEKGYLRLEKTIYGSKKTIYGLRLFLQNSWFIFDHMTHF